MKKENIIISALVVLIAITLWGIFRGPQIEAPVLPLGAAESSTYKNITSSDASATVPVVVRSNGGVLASITIASSSPALTGGLGIRVYDACCSATSTATSTLIGKFMPDDAEQTYTLNYAVANGIVLDVPAGYNGSIIIGSQ